MPSAIEPQTFVSVVRPLLESNDIEGLAHALKSRWNCGQIARLATQGDKDSRKIALLCLAIIGDSQCIDAVQSQLADADLTLNQMAEHALWSIWCRIGTPEANGELCRGSRAMNDKNLDQAIEHFNRAIAIDPTFSEAFNQRALARFMQDEFESSIADCRKVVRLMPCHFGAWAGMGHCFVHLGQLDHALRSYERAIAINPHLVCVQQTAAEIRKRLGV